MATTTNYGWTTPDNTDLVKDGASAIRTLGSSIDTTVKALSPGTTAGDIDYYTSSTAKSKVAIGTTGQVLTVSGGVPTWATSSSGSMTLLATTTLSGGSTVVSSISQSYKSLVFIGYNITYSGELDFKVNPNSTEGISRSIGTYYENESISNIANTSIYPYTGAGLTSNSANSFYLVFNNYSSTSRKPFQCYATHATKNSVAIFGGTVTQASAITSMEFTKQSGGSTFTGGTVLTYGVN